MPLSLLLGAFLAALFYVLIPGPAFLQLLGIGAGQGRKAGAFFMMGHLVGDLVWSGLALVAIVGARTIGTFVFDLLGLACGFYLAWIGWSAVNARPKAEGQALLVVERPPVAPAALLVVRREELAADFAEPAPAAAAAAAEPSVPAQFAADLSVLPPIDIPE